MFFHRRTGFSLIEAILASFLLLTAVLMSVSVFDSSFQAEVSNEKRVMAAIVAESALAEVRQAASKNYSSARSTYSSKSWTLAEYPDFNITSRAENTKLAVPCTVLETQYPMSNSFPDPEGRYLESSAFKVEITVTWEDHGKSQVSIVENVVNFTPAANFKIQLLLPSGAPATPATLIKIAKNDTRKFTVRARSGGQVIEDVQYTWSVQPITGFGSIDTVSRDGTRCKFINRYYNFRREAKYAPGACKLVVTAIYQGIESKSEVLIENEA